MAQIIIVAQKSGVIPEIISSGKTISRIQSMAIFIIIPKSPKVKSLIGRLTNFITGLINKLIRPRISPAANKVCKDPVNSTPDTNRAASQRPKIPDKI